MQKLSFLVTVNWVAERFIDELFLENNGLRPSSVKNEDVLEFDVSIKHAYLDTLF